METKPVSALEIPTNDEIGQQNKNVRIASTPLVRQARQISPNSSSDSETEENPPITMNVVDTNVFFPNPNITPEPILLEDELDEPEIIINQNVQRSKIESTGSPEEIETDIKLKSDENKENSITVKPEGEFNVETNVITKVESEVEPEVEPEVERKIEADVEPEVEQIVKPEVKSEVEPRIEPEVVPEVERDIEAEVELKVEPVVKPEIEPEVEPENLRGNENDTEFETATDGHNVLVTKLKVENDNEHDSKSDSNESCDPVVETEQSELLPIENELNEQKQAAQIAIVDDLLVDKADIQLEEAKVEKSEENKSSSDNNSKIDSPKKIDLEVSTTEELSENVSQTSKIGNNGEENVVELPIVISQELDNLEDPKTIEVPNVEARSNKLVQSDQNEEEPEAGRLDNIETKIDIDEADHVTDTNPEQSKDAELQEEQISLSEKTLMEPTEHEITEAIKELKQKLDNEDKEEISSETSSIYGMDLYNSIQ